MELLDFCYDILIHILEEVDAPDLGACAQTSWAFNNFIKANQRLFKTHYLKICDDPRRKPTDPEPDWIGELTNVVKCKKILSSDNEDVKRENFKFVASTVELLLSSASERNGESQNKASLIQAFNRPLNLHSFMYRSSLYKRAGTETQQAAEDEEDQQLSAKLHCLHGMASGALGRRSLSTHSYAKSRVYDLRNYTAKSGWGPFKADGSMSVDWEMMESIMIDLAYNSDVCCPRFMPHYKPVWSVPFGGIVPDRLRAQYPPTLYMEPEVPLDLKDPYNITGIWHRIVCFLDYNDLYAFNFGPTQPPSDEERLPLETDEAIRHIMMKLQVTDVQPAGRFDNGDLPVVHFTGMSRSMDASWDPNANSRIRGTVRLTTEGEVRWTTISIFYGGEERWRSEGIQVGGINSKRGVAGTWFDKNYDPHGPAGPTAFWKMADMSLKEVDEDDQSGSESESDDW